MAPAGGSQRWYFSDEELANSPSRKCGVNADKEESYRQQAAHFIQDMGQRLQVPQLCINTAIVFMQRFYTLHSFTRFHRNNIAAAALFLAAKVEEQPRKLEHVIKTSSLCLNRHLHMDTKSEKYLEQAQELVSNENILLQTLGFDVGIDHPHTHVVRCVQLVKAQKELAQTSYFMATNSLHLTNMCLRYPPTVIACVCIHISCKWSNYEIPASVQNRPWYTYIDSNVTIEQIERLTSEFLAVFEKCPSRLKKKILQSHNDTKDQEERRKRENTQNTEYRIDFGDGTVSNVSMQTHHSLGPPGNPLAGGGLVENPSAKHQQGTSSHKPPSSHSMKQSSSSSKLPPGHGQPQPHTKPGPPVQHKSSSMPGQPGRSSSSSSKHNSSLDKIVAGGRGDGHHGRSQSHGGSHQQLTEDQLRQQQRERHHREQYKHQQQQQQQQQGQNMYAGYGRSSSSSSLPPPYPGSAAGQHMSSKSQSQGSQHQKQQSSMGSMSRSIFDSPEKAPRPEKPPPPLGPIHDPMPGSFDPMIPTPPNYPHPHQPPPPPSYQSTSMPHSLPPYPKPGEPPFQPPQNLSPIRDNPPQLSLNTRHAPQSLDQGVIDTPTPTHIANMFFQGQNKPNYPNQNQTNVQARSRDDRSLDSILGFGHGHLPSDKKELQKVLFDDFDDLPMSSMSSMPLPPAPTISTVPSSMSQSKKTSSVSDFSELFGDESDSSSLFSSLGGNQQSSSHMSQSFSGSSHPNDMSNVKQEHSSIKQEHFSTSQVKTEPSYENKRDESDKRKSSDKIQSEDKRHKPSRSGLFSPSPPDEKPSIPSLKSPEQEHKRLRTTSSSSKNDSDAVVNVPKLESLAPEFEAFKNNAGPASIIVGPDGLPSPSKLKKEGNPSPSKSSKTQDSGAEKKRSGSGSKDKPLDQGASGSHSSPLKASSDAKKNDEKKDHKKKKEKKEKKDKKEKKHKKEKRRDNEDSGSDKEKKHKKDKKKSKDKEKDKERDKSKGSSSETPKVKIKVSGSPECSPGNDGQEAGGSTPAIPKLKLKLSGGTVRNLGEQESGSKKDKESRKRERSSSSAKLDKFEVPAAKMARATGADPSRESKFLEESFKKKERR